MVWSEVREVDWQNEQQNPNCKVISIEFDLHHFSQDFKTKLMESHPRLKQLLTESDQLTSRE
jgi:hypothetical protein